MSSTKGNLARTRPQKHQNRSAFKNDLYDKSVKTKFINSIQPHGICSRCKEIIEWKIKYKKYKPLTAPKTCVRCDQKAVKHAYHVMCLPCSKNERVCAKCCKSEECEDILSERGVYESKQCEDVLMDYFLQELFVRQIAQPNEHPVQTIIEVKLTTPAEDEEMKRVIKALPERKRRTLLRYLKKQQEGPKKDRKRDAKDANDIDEADVEKQKNDLTEKINKLKLDAQQENIEDYDSDFDDFDSDCEDSENGVSDSDDSNK